jgi:endonuclease/exonuclease/phosphatase family metal-dependent hydrolase
MAHATLSVIDTVTHVRSAVVRAADAGGGADVSAHRPRRQLDHVLTDDPGLVVRHRETPLMPISDHRPLVVDLERH